MANQATNLDLRAGLLAANTTFDELMADLFVAMKTGTHQYYAHTYKSDSETLQLDMLGPTPVMEKVGQAARIEKFLRHYKYDIGIETYSADVWLERTLVQYDKTGSIGRRMANFADNQPNFYDKLALACLIANPTGYDGVSLLSASHPHADAGGVWANTTTNALNELNYLSAIETAEDITLENGEPAMVNFTHLLCGPKNKKTARRLLQADQRVAAYDHQGKVVDEMGDSNVAIQNIYRGELDVIVDRRLRGGTYDYYWYLLDASRGAVKPIIIKENMAPQATTRQNAEDPRVWADQQFGWGLLADVVCGPGAPQMVSGHLATAGGF